MAAAVAVTLVTGVDYVRDAIRLRREGPGGRPARRHDQPVSRSIAAGPRERAAQTLATAESLTGRSGLRRHRRRSRRVGGAARRARGVRQRRQGLGARRRSSESSTQHGVVSRECAEAMAVAAEHAVRHRLGGVHDRGRRAHRAGGQAGRHGVRRRRPCGPARPSRELRLDPATGPTIRAAATDAVLTLLPRHLDDPLESGAAADLARSARRSELCRRDPTSEESLICSECCGRGEALAARSPGSLGDTYNDFDIGVTVHRSAERSEP